MQQKKMKTGKIYLITSWILLAIYLLDFAFDLLTMANTFSNFIGVIFIITIIIVSIRLIKALKKPKKTEDEKTR